MELPEKVETAQRVAGFGEKLKSLWPGQPPVACPAPPDHSLSESVGLWVGGHLGVWLAVVLVVIVAGFFRPAINARLSHRRAER